MILQIILLIIFLAWTLKRNLGELISEIHCITTIFFTHFLLKTQKTVNKKSIFSEVNDRISYIVESNNSPNKKILYMSDHGHFFKFLEPWVRGFFPRTIWRVFYFGRNFQSQDYSFEILVNLGYDPKS
jgi:hypothetical protein